MSISWPPSFTLFLLVSVLSINWRYKGLFPSQHFLPCVYNQHENQLLKCSTKHLGKHKKPSFGFVTLTVLIILHCAQVMCLHISVCIILCSVYWHPWRETSLLAAADLKPGFKEHICIIKKKKGNVNNSTVMVQYTF